MADAASLTVLAGPLAGTRLVIPEAGGEVLIGSAADCRLVLDAPGVSPIHARLSLDAQGATVFDTRSPRGVYVNDDRVAGQAPLRHGDILWLGSPQDAASVMIQCQFPRAQAAPAVPAERDDFFVASEPAVPEASEPDFGTPIDFLMDEPAAAPARPAPAVSGAGSTADGHDDFFVVESKAPPPTASPGPAAIPMATLDALFDVPAPPTPAPVPPAPRQPRPATPAPSAPAASTAGGRGPVAPSAAAAGGPAASAAPRASGPLPQRSTPVAAPGGAPARIEPPPRPRPAARPGTAAGRSPAPGPRRAPATAPRAPAGRGGVPLTLVAAGLVAVLALAAGAFVLTRQRAAPVLGGVQPARASAGHTVTITGANFSATATENDVTIGGLPARVLQAAPGQLQVEVPDAPTTPGQDTPAPVVVMVGGRATEPGTLALFRAPRLRSIVPEVALPGETVSLNGSGWDAGAQVRFGETGGQVTAASGTVLQVVVPALEVGPGTEVPVTVLMGGEPSNVAPLMVGRLPLVTGLEPRAAQPGDIVTVAGRGFASGPGATTASVNGVPALVVAAAARELRVALPRGVSGEVDLQVRVAGSEGVGQVALTVAPAPDPIDLRFYAEPHADQPGHDHAAISTGLGPAFILSASGAGTAGERAAEAVKRLNEAAVTLRASLDAEIRARNVDSNPLLVLSGREAAWLVEVLPEDAAGYAEDWTGLRGRGGAVTPGRLAIWWEAVMRDLVLMLARGEAPRYAAALAPEGRVLGELHAAARRATGGGVPAQLLAEGKPAQREALRVLALRVPAAVRGPGGAAGAAADGGAPGAAPLRLQGAWTGSEVDPSGARKFVSVVFGQGTGTLTYQGALTMSVPVHEIVQRGARVQFIVLSRGRTLHYKGQWDGARLSGSVTGDAEGRQPVGTFELSPVAAR